MKKSGCLFGLFGVALLLSGCVTHEWSPQGTGGQVSGVESPPPVEAAVGPGPLFTEDFSHPSSAWNLYAGEQYQASAEYRMENEEAVLDVRAAGTEAHGIQFRRADISLIRGQTYTLQFRARADAPRTIEVNFCQNTAPYTAYSKVEKIDISDQMADYSVVFTMEESSDPAGRLRFRLGKYAEGRVFLDDISLSIN